MPLFPPVRRMSREAASLRRRLFDGGRAVERSLEELKVLAAEPAVQRIRSLPSIDPARGFRDVELRVFSQFGDDGIIQYLVHHLPISADTFVEFGVSDYRESNTRYLLVRDNWRGFVMDGSADNVATIEADELSWRHDLQARAAFVTKDNVDDLIRSAEIEGRIGLLHIDIDGNDYWVWQALTAVSADVVIVEYNAVFGPTAAVTVPYDPAFERSKAHPSFLFWGASLAALVSLGVEKGYRFVGCNSAGNNAYFVKREIADALPSSILPAPALPGGFVDSRFRESRGPDGRLDHLRGAARRQAIEELEVVDVATGRKVRLRDAH